MLQIQKSQLEGNVSLMKMTGRLTLGRSCQEFEMEMNQLIDGGTPRVILDGTNLEYIDSAGVGLLVMVASKATAAGGQAVLAGTKGFVLDVIHRCKVDTLVRMADSVEQAQGFLGASSAHAGN